MVEVINILVYIICTASVILFINYKGDIIMANVADLQVKIDELTQAEAAREQRDILQDGVTQQQVSLLTQTVTDLQTQIANGVQIPDSIITSIQATIDSLNAADPTPPVV
jgi:hypothetical protein